MRIGKIKKVCKDAETCRIATTEGYNNMITQWVGTTRAMYPVRGMKVDYDMLQVIWEIAPDKWRLMISDAEYYDERLDNVSAEIDIKSAPDNFVAEVNGYFVYGDEKENGLYSMWMVEKNLLDPCYDGKKSLHVIRIGQYMAAVYCGSLLAGVVAVASDEHCGNIARICEKIAEMEVNVK